MEEQVGWGMDSRHCLGRDCHRNSTACCASGNVWCRRYRFGRVGIGPQWCKGPVSLQERQAVELTVQVEEGHKGDMAIFDI